MRKLILSLALTAFAASLTAGETNSTATSAPACDSAKASSSCPASSGCCGDKAEAGKCPAGGDQKPAESAKSGEKATK